MALQRYRYEGENFRVMGEPDVLVKVPAWAIYFSGIVKNVLVYNKVVFLHLFLHSFTNRYRILNMGINPVCIYPVFGL